jgi:hypothetical protein
MFKIWRDRQTDREILQTNHERLRDDPASEFSAFFSICPAVNDTSNSLKKTEH